MTLYIICILISIIVISILAAPFFKKTRPEATFKATTQAESVYKDQLAELERDQARGVIALEEAKTARAEIGRRLLSLQKPPPDTRHKTVPKMAALLLCLTIPVAAIALYLKDGSPNSPAFPFTERPVASSASGSERISELAYQLEAYPKDAAGWMMLGTALIEEGRIADSLPALEQALTLTNGTDAQIAALYAETISVLDGTVPVKAKNIFENIIRDDPENPQARFYIALYKAQNNDVAGAISDLNALKADSPPNAPWLTSIEEQLSVIQNQ